MSKEIIYTCDMCGEVGNFCTIIKYEHRILVEIFPTEVHVCGECIGLYEAFVLMMHRVRYHKLHQDARFIREVLYGKDYIYPEQDGKLFLTMEEVDKKYSHVWNGKEWVKRQ